MKPKAEQQRNKRILAILALVFLAAVIYTTYDIMSKTTHPGARKHLPNSILK
jgi:hypothetical protein